jgi:hypothetical protein
LTASAATAAVASEATSEVALEVTLDVTSEVPSEVASDFATEFASDAASVAATALDFLLKKPIEPAANFAADGCDQRNKLALRDFGTNRDFLRLSYVSSPFK